MLTLVSSPETYWCFRWIRGGGLPLSAEGGLALHPSVLRHHLETDTEQVGLT